MADSTSTDATKPTLIPPPLVPETLQYRLETGNIAKQGGQKGSLTRCAQKLGIFQHQLLGTATPDAQEIESSKQDLMRDLELCQLELYKLLLLQRNLERQVQRNEQAQQEREQAIEQWTQELQSSQSAARQAQWTQSCFLEYEALATMIQEHHPQSSRILQEQLSDVEKQMVELKQEESVTDHMIRVREGQFHLLIQYMLDLKRSLNDTEDEERLLDVAHQVSTTGTTTITTNTTDHAKPEKGSSRAASRSKEKASRNQDVVDSMDVDEEEEEEDNHDAHHAAADDDDNDDNDEDEDGEEGLYNDLI